MTVVHLVTLAPLVIFKVRGQGHGQMSFGGDATLCVSLAKYYLLLYVLEENMVIYVYLHL